jgi:hypothetical protein
VIDKEGNKKVISLSVIGDFGGGRFQQFRVSRDAVRPIALCGGVCFMVHVLYTVHGVRGTICEEDTANIFSYGVRQ